MAALINLKTGEAIKVAEVPQWKNGAWYCGDQIFGDEKKTDYAAGPPAVGPIRFKLLFQITELVAIADLMKVNPVVKTFMDIVDDPRTDVIDLSLSAVQDGIGYVLSQVYNSPDQAALLELRVMAILSGQLD